MNSRAFVFTFLGLGILFAFLSIYWSLQPLAHPIRYGYPVFKPYGIVIMGFLSGVCFFVTGMLVKKNRV
jgi:hypothetical protein